MISLNALTYPYQVLAPLVPPLLTLSLAYLATCLVLAVRSRDGGVARAALTAATASAAALLSASWLYAASGEFALIGLALFVAALAMGVGRGVAPAEGDPAPHWSGVAVIVAATAVKCVALGDFPAHLNAYSAESGLWGIATLDGAWPQGFFRGKEYDLVNGGQSPLHLPLSWVSVRLFGGTIYALRFTEVAASTGLLCILWVWLRGRLPGWWSVAALASFAFSPWHLAQSRMGTFFSASVALGLALLLIGDRLATSGRDRLSWWVAFGTCAGLIGYAYAPLKVLYLFFVVVTVGCALRSVRSGRAGWWRDPLAALTVLSVMIAIQLGWPPRFDEMFRRDFGPLATDTSVWHKTPADEVTAETQPLSVVTTNLTRNLGEWWQRTWSEHRILPWYAAALSAAVPTSVVLLLSSAYRVPALYFLIGVLPPLIIFPVQRRTLVLWPLVYVAAVLLARALAGLCAGLVDRGWWRTTTWALLVACGVTGTAYGLSTYAATNSMVGVGTYFGPEYRLEMLLEAERMLSSCRVYLVNATIEEKVVANVRLFEPARRVGDPDRFGFVEYTGEVLAVPRDMPICFFHLDRPDDPPQARGVLEELAKRFTGAMLMRRWAGDGSGTLLYQVLMVAAGERGVEGREDAPEQQATWKSQPRWTERTLDPAVGGSSRASVRRVPSGDGPVCFATEFRQSSEEEGLQ